MMEIADIRKIASGDHLKAAVCPIAIALPTQIGTIATVYIGGLIAAIHNFERSAESVIETKAVRPLSKPFLSLKFPTEVRIEFAPKPERSPCNRLTGSLANARFEPKRSFCLSLDRLPPVRCPKTALKYHSARRKRSAIASTHRRIAELYGQHKTRSERPDRPLRPNA
ncbi:MAG: hypothetical protein ACFB9N_09430 [Geitlerinemataceae cyanobacterium]